MGKFGDRLAHAWNAFMNKDPTVLPSQYYYGGGSGSKQDRVVLTRGNERSIINAIYNRIAMDVAINTFQHVRNDTNGRFVEVIDDGINKCLNLEANIDQTGRQFIQDLILSMLDEGTVVALPTKTDINPKSSTSFDITSMRVGKVVEWFPQFVRVRYYNERTGQKTEAMFDKSKIAIIENPFYTVMNEPNSMASRLLRKLSLMDVVDERNYSGKLDLIIQLPYSTRTELRKNQADKRLSDLQDQLIKSPYGIAYTDATEKIIQLNRSLENNFMKQIEYFQNLLYSQFGITQSIMDGTADENVMQNYINRTIEPMCAAIINEFKRKFLSKTARTQGQSFAVFTDPFRLVPATKVADLADKLTRNEIMTSNEVRQCIGLKPSNDPDADALRNKNINQSNEDILMRSGEYEDYDTSMQQLDDIDRQIADLEKML